MTLMEAIHKVLDKYEVLLKERNDIYGDSVVNPPMIFTSHLNLSPRDFISVLLDVKLSRLFFGNNHHEDTIQDIAGYIILYQALKLIEQEKNSEKIP